MAKKRKKLTEEKINRNSSAQISHSIKKIKENEFKYTVFLVIIFMLLFCYIGYSTLSVNTKDVLKYDINNNSIEETFNSHERVTLTEKDVMDDFLGFQSRKHIIDITNQTSKDISYSVFFVRDDEEVSACGCESSLDSFSYIHYSLDGKTAMNLSNNNEIMSKGTLLSGKSKSIVIQMWLDESFPGGHIHGKFIVREV